jgi:hypothetical protein
VSPDRMRSCLRHYLRVLLRSFLLTVICIPPIFGQTGGVAGAATSQTNAAPSLVSGQVVNANTGLPIERALVRFNERAVLTGHDGRFQFDQNTEASGSFQVIKPGFYSTIDPGDTANTHVQGSQLVNPLRLLLYPEALLTGRIAAPDGTPLSHISVIALRSIFDESGQHMVNAAQTQSDSHGDFRLPVPAGDYRVETRYVALDQTIDMAVLPVSFPKETSSSTLEVRSGQEQQIDLHPASGPTHTVTATTESSQRGFGFPFVTAHARDGSALQLSLKPTGIGGEAKIELPQGTYTLLASRNGPEGPEEAETTVTVPDHDISGVVLHFSPTPAIPVELLIDDHSTAEKGQPGLAQFNLTLQNNQRNEEQASSIRLTRSHDSSFVFLAPFGSYHLQAGGSSVWYIESVTYGASDLLQQDLTVAPGAGGTAIRVTVSNQTGSLQGTVSVNGNPGACWIYLVSATPRAQAFISLRSNGDGVYSNTHLPPGSYQAIAFENRRSANYRAPASLAPFSSYLHALTIDAGEKTTLNLDAVPRTESTP